MWGGRGLIKAEEGKGGGRQSEHVCEPGSSDAPVEPAASLRLVMRGGEIERGRRAMNIKFHLSREKEGRQSLEISPVVWPRCCRL